MAFDHSIRFKQSNIKNLVHKARLNEIIKILKNGDLTNKSFADIGCSNGYLTALIAEKCNPREAHGYDYLPEHLDAGRKSYPFIQFHLINLNAIEPPAQQHDMVTCFQVLEHVGNLHNALINLVNLTKPQGLLFLAAPIEIGWQGLIRFLAKTTIYRYKLTELPPKNNLHAKYLMTLVGGGRISNFREPRNAWGTHFGFDYRDIDDFLKGQQLSHRAYNKLGTRYYLINP